MARKYTGLYRPKYKDPKSGELRESSIWWLRFYCKRCTVHPLGGKHRESSGTEKVTEAQLELDKKRGAVAKKEPVLKQSPATMDEILQLVVDDYKDKGRKTVSKVEASQKEHLIPFFGGRQAEFIRTDDIEAYKRTRRGENAKMATVNNELAIVSKAFALAMERQKISARFCKITRYSDKVLNNARQGMLSEEQFRSLVKKLPADVAAPLIFAFETGWRNNSEVITREWRHTDLDEGKVWLEAEETKNKQPRTFFFSPEECPAVDAVLRQQMGIHEELKREGVLCSYIFHHDGEPLFYWNEKQRQYRPSTYFRKAWKKATQEAGLAGAIPHDFRRVAVSRYENAGVSRKLAMDQVGHLTESVYRRYHIAKEEDYRDTQRQVQQYRKEQAAKKAAGAKN